MAQLTPSEVRAAAARIGSHVRRTPLYRSAWLSQAADGDVFLKLETLQPTHSYKIRGATNAVLVLAERSRRPALVTASAGNHGRALAHAAAAAGMHLTVYVPESAPRAKIDAIRELGGEVRPCSDYDAAERRAKSHGARGIGVYISPYAHPDVIAGAGTVAAEILEEEDAIDTLVASVGGGGLISGMAIAAGERAEVVGAEVDASTPFTSSFAAGRLVQIEVKPSLADGLTGNLDPDSPTFDLVRRRIKRIVVVPEHELREAICAVAHHEKLIIEGATAVAVAAVANRRIDLRGRRAAVVLSGANIDTDKLAALLAEQ